MPVNESKRLTPPVLATDFDVYEAIQSMDGYTPVRPEFTLEEARHQLIIEIAPDLRGCVSLC